MCRLAVPILVHNINGQRREEPHLALCKPLQESISQVKRQGMLTSGGLGLGLGLGLGTF
jgi:hypothetical protein